MDILEKLSELIDALPADSATRGNLLVVRATIKAGEPEERRLQVLLTEFAQEALQRLGTLQ